MRLAVCGSLRWLRGGAGSCSEEAAFSGEDIPSIYRRRMQTVMQRQAKATQSRYSGWGKH
jgi:hypothetical protein